MVHNKNAFTMQFSWIFVLIVGFLIILLVTTIITRQKDTSETDINVEISKNMDSILTSAEQSANTFKIIEIPESKLQRVCEDNYSAYMINKNIQRVENSIFFMPKIIENRKLYAWSKEYFMPMKIANVLYLTDSKHIYIFFNTSNNLYNKVFDDFPKNITYDLINYTDLKEYNDRNYDEYTFIIVNSSAVSIDTNDFPTDSKVKKNSNIIVIDYNLPNTNKGNITFYKYNSSGYNKKTEEFIHESMLYGAIFAGDHEGYLCNTQKLLDKSANIYKIYNYTTAKMKENDRGLITKSRCLSNDGFYAESLVIFTQIFNEVERKDLQSIYSLSINLNNYNQELIVMGCPNMY